jgi:putative Mg2+ transporter-C (MgtC) family protein
MHMVKDENIMLRNLDSHDIELGEKVNVKAEVISVGKNEMSLEKIVSRISLESGVVAIGWEIKV